MHQKVVTLIICLTVFFIAGFSKSYGQVQKSSLLNIETRIEIPLIFTSNAYKTPSVRFINPETGNWAEATPTSAFYIEPKVNLLWKKNISKGQSFTIDLKFKGTRYLGNTKLVDGEGQNTHLETGYKGKTGNHKWYLAYIIKNQDYNYLHRGTGESRITADKKLPQGHRYKYLSSGASLSYHHKFSKVTRVYFDYRSIYKNYDDVIVFQNLDREESSYRLSFSHVISKEYRLRISQKITDKTYRSHNAENLEGKLVAGTKLNLKDTSRTIKLTFRSEGYSLKPYLTMFDSVDLYQGFASYNEQELGIGFRTDFKAVHEIVFNINLLQRQYAHEVNILNELRNRTSQFVEVGLHYFIDDSSKANILISNFHQEDVDSYYSYDEMKLIFGYNKKFQ